MDSPPVVQFPSPGVPFLSFAFSRVLALITIPAKALDYIIDEAEEQGGDDVDFDSFFEVCKKRKIFNEFKPRMFIALGSRLFLQAENLNACPY